MQKNKNRKKLTPKVKRKYGVYLSGPMSGIAKYNFPEFNRVAKILRDNFASSVFNPAETMLDVNIDEACTPGEGAWNEYLRYDIQRISESESMVLLEGWRESKGASLEVYIAQAIGIPILQFSEYKGLACLEKLKETVCQEADRAVSGDRGENYGHPFEDFTRTGKIWRGILETENDIPPEKVAMCMIGVKLSRELNRSKRDNRVDICGYAKTLDMVRDRQENGKS